MCKTKMAVDVETPVVSARTSRTRSSNPPSTATASASSSAVSTSKTSSRGYSTRGTTTTSSSNISSRTSLSSLRDSISQSPNIYDISEIRAATNNFLAKRYSAASTACWRCILRRTETIVFQRKFRRKIELSHLKERLSVICRSHHSSVIKLLGVSISGEHIYLVYEFIAGANLSDCLRNPRNPNFTVLSTWTSRMQIAADLAHGLDYIHNQTGLNLTFVHNHIKSSAVIVTEPHFSAKICHFGTAQLCGEICERQNEKIKGKSEIVELEDQELRRSNSLNIQFEGVRGYMSPEFQITGVATQQADVYAFGVVILELLSGDEPLKFKLDKSTGNFERTSLIETATAVVKGGDGTEGRLRRWMDRRLKDSYPVDVADKLARLAVQCVHVDPDQRPDMGRVAGKISKLYLASKNWSDQMVRVSDQISVSLAPR